jgi:hypothetical protein
MGIVGWRFLVFSGALPAGGHELLVAERGVVIINIGDK